MNNIIKKIRTVLELNKKGEDYDNNNTKNYVLIDVEYIEHDITTKSICCYKCNNEKNFTNDDYEICPKCNTFNGNPLGNKHVQDLCESFDIEIEEEKNIKYYGTDDSVLCKMKVGNYYGVMLGWICYEHNDLSSTPHDDYKIEYYLYTNEENRDDLYENYEKNKLIYKK